MTLIFFLLFQIGFEIKVYQNEAILGEPIIAEANKDFDYILNFSNGFYVEFEGPKYFCIKLEEIVEDRLANRANITRFIKEEGEYKITFLFDPLQTCKMRKLSQEEREENERIIKEADEARKEGRFFDSLDLMQKLKEDREKLRESLKKDGSFEVLGEKIIKINYPIDYDKFLWINLLSKEEDLKSFWKNYNEDMKDILEHSESNYFPWALYLYIKKGTSLLLPIRFESQLEDFEKNFNIYKKAFINPPETTFEAKSIIKYVKEKIDLLEKKYKDFPFFYEIEFERLIMGFVIRENKSQMEKRAEEIINNCKNKKLKDVALKVLDFIKKEYNVK